MFLPAAQKISAIICVYNGVPHLRKAVKSALAQSHPEVEVVVVNDGSTDESAAVCRAFGDRIVYLSQPNKGLANARNLGIRASTGNYIAFLDQDDVWYPEKIERQMELFEKNPNLGFVYSDYSQIDGSDRMICEKSAGSCMKRGLPEVVLPELYETNFISSLTVVVPKKVLDRVGLFWEELRYSLDWDLWMRIAFEHPVDFVEDAMGSWRVRPNYAEFRHEIMLIEAYKIIKERHPQLSSRLTPQQNAGVESRLARISSSLGRLYRRLGKEQAAADWSRISLEHETSVLT